MDISYPLLIDIYDYLLMSHRHKLIKSCNKEYLDVILKEDLVKRYQLWMSEGRFILIDYIKSDVNESKIIQLIDTFEELCQVQYMNEFGSTVLMRCCGKNWNRAI